MSGFELTKKSEPKEILDRLLRKGVFMDYDITKLSPSISRYNTYNNFSAKIMVLAKKQLEITGELAEEILEMGKEAVSPVGGAFDVSI